MENEKSLFNLEVDDTAKYHLADIAKWARFLSILGFVCLGIVVLTCTITSINTIINPPQDPFGEPTNITSIIIGAIFVAVVVVGLYFFPCYFLLKFANKMKKAIAADDSASLNESLKNLKITFRYVGVLTIIFLILGILGILGNLSGSN